MTHPFRDVTRPLEERIQLLLNEMTVEEKLSQINYRNAAIPRLGIPEYVWWNEALHGLARSGAATVFPQAIAMAATFSRDLIHRMGRIIALEGRARHHESLRQGDRGTYKGLTYWSPNVNIFRDPRWGRGQETYGEDPFLTGSLGVAYVRGVQGDDPRYLKACATPKHFAVHSGPEATRLSFDSTVSPRDLRETYLPAFEMCVKAGANSVMSAYNAINGTPACMNRFLLMDILREEWGFDGAVVSDAGAGEALYKEHKRCADYAEAAALELQNGGDCLTDWETGVVEAHRRGLITEADIDRALRNLLRVKFRLGFFDPEEMVPLTDTPYEIIECDEHRQTALEASRRAIVLLRNRNGLLPLNRKSLKSIAVIGPNADQRDILLGNYHGTPTRHITPLEGILQAIPPGCRLWHARGCEHLGKRTEPCAEDNDRIAEAVAIAQKSDVVIMFMGLTPRIEGEAGDAFNSEAAGDKTGLDLPGLQNVLIEKIVATGKPVILCLISGSALAPVWADDHVPAILQAWYPGAEGGRAIAEILFGDVNPSGRLPVTFYRSQNDLPPFEDYSMENRTYRFFRGEPLYPFGYGLSYTKFTYENLRVSLGETITVEATVKNTGDLAGEEVVQVYVADADSSQRVPIRQLAAFQRIALAPGQSMPVRLEVDFDRLKVTNDAGRQFVEPGSFHFFLGGSQPDERSTVLTGVKPLETVIELSLAEIPPALRPPA
ncbi:glycoside hydrolase family 3 C-terminal domain-containing protein [Oscillatoria laete-virens NRMC-F 0139]|nr:glycoside hydrolase family 3 C-terminal domain-containing protein [Oscillatoria laete-virens]MDL5053621.1 glycoside hydrolase family 3 C-terminal domain-containing protein [Oscillatoria laete-virens NRMC-F 0139]